jgi:trimethylamine:corrinoid methyltransferase-like protein
VRELWQAKLGETGSYDAWKNAGARSTTEKAQEKVAEILAAPAPEFPADLGAEFEAIIAAAAREAAAV